MSRAARATAAKKHSRLGTQMRAQLAEPYASRGHHHSSLWLAFSPKANADVVLRSDLEFGHFLLAESDPSVVKVDYAPQKRVAQAAGEAVGTIVDAEVTLRNGTVIWREIKCSEDVAHGTTTRANTQLMAQVQAAGLVGAMHEVLTEKEIYAQPQRTQNWLQVIPWLAQAREWPLYEFRLGVVALLNARRSVEFEDVLALGNVTTAALYAAALFDRVQYGFILSDLDTLPFTACSRFYLREAPP